MSGAEEFGYVVSRWVSGEVGGAVGMYGGAQIGGASGGICGPAVEACAPLFAIAGGFIGGVTGDAGGTWVFDNWLGGDAFLRRKAAQTLTTGGGGGW